MLYSIYNNSKKYAYLGFDWKQIVDLFGESPENPIRCQLGTAPIQRHMGRADPGQI